MIWIGLTNENCSMSLYCFQHIHCFLLTFFFKHLQLQCIKAYDKFQSFSTSWRSTQQGLLSMPKTLMFGQNGL